MDLVAEELATWEDEATIVARFPQVAAWGQAIPQGRKNVKDIKESDEDNRPEAQPKSEWARMDPLGVSSSVILFLLNS
jgi:hypothetical protein